MKKRILSLLLALCLLCALPVLPAAADGAVAAPDFDALIRKGETVDPVNAVFVSCEARLPAFYYAWNVGNYLLCLQSDQSLAVYDKYGTLIWKLPKEITDANLIEGGFLTARIGSNKLVYSPTGKALCTDYSIGFGQPVQTGKSGEIVLFERYARDLSTKKNCALIVRSSGKTLAAEDFGRICEGMTTRCIGGKWDAIDLDGTQLLSGDYDYLEFANDGVLICRQGDKYGMITLDKTEVVPFEYDELRVLRNDGYRRAAARKDGKWGVIDLEGNVRVPLEYDTAPENVDYSSIGPEHFEWYAIRPNEGYYYVIAEDDAVLLRGSRRIETSCIVVNADRFFEKTGTMYACVNADGEPLPQMTDILTIEPFNGGYYLTFDVGENYAVGRIYDTQLQCKREIPQVASFISASTEYVRFGATDKVLAVQQFKPTAVGLYTNNGELIRTEEKTQLTGVLNNKTIVLQHKEGKKSSFGDGLSMTPFQYDGVKEVCNGALVCAGISGKWYIMSNSGKQLVTEPTDLLDKLDKKDCGTLEFRSEDLARSGFVTVCPVGTSFLDNEASNWFHESVEFCANAGLMNGVGNGMFSPRKVMTRAMLVQVLYNLSGERCADHGFADVKANAWYRDAVNWAAAKGIVTGKTETRFGPNDPVTREQMVTILRRYALHFTQADGAEDALAGFDDAESVSAYALDAMRWAASAGLIQGVSAGEIRPGGQTTRAQIATILTRFVRLMAAQAEK